MAKKISWQQRTAELRKAAVLEILHRPANESENKAIPRVARKYNGRKLPDGKYHRLSKSTLKRLYYAYKRGQSDKVFDFNYTEGPRDPMAHWLIGLLESHAMANGFTIRKLHEELKVKDPAFPLSIDSFYRHLPEESKQRIANAASIIRKQNSLSKKLGKLNEGSEK